LNFLTLSRQALRLAPPDAEAEVRKELALALYARGILGFGKARELCGLTKWQFEELLGRRKVVRPYDEDDLAADLAYAQQLAAKRKKRTPGKRSQHVYGSRAASTLPKL